VKLLATLCFLALAACNRSHSPLVITEPCADFVTNFAPYESPKLVRSGGQLLLEVPFTPAAGYEEVEQMAKAAKNGPIVARVQKTGREFIIQGRGSAGIMVYVDSVEHAEAILRDLCYEGEQAKLKSP
jgi:hypothetical protein